MAGLQALLGPSVRKSSLGNPLAKAAMKVNCLPTATS